MTEKSSSKLRSHHIIENHGHMAEVTKEPMADFKYIQTHAEINTEQIPRVQDIGTNTSENNEQINATVNNDNVPKETVEILLTGILTVQLVVENPRRNSFIILLKYSNRLLL